MPKIISITILSTALLYLGHRTGYAANFTIGQDIHYSCVSSETCKVANEVSITNNTNKVFADEYTLNTGLKNLSEINAKDSKKRALFTKVINKNGQTSISVEFEKPTLGKGNTTNISISYITKETIKRMGKIWEISIPKISRDEGMENTKISVSVPKDFGPLMYISPKPSGKREEINKTTYLFNTDIATNGINIAFGKYQLFNFEIYYYLKNNNNILSKTVEVPFPPNIKNTQEVFITGLNLKPNNLKMDSNGNYIAQYKLDPNQTKRVEIYGLIKVLNKEIDPSRGGHFEDIPKQLIEKYTKQQKYWETKDEKIAKIANDLISRNETVSENARKAYMYTISHLKYSVERTKRGYLKRFGASKALQNPQNAVCMEFTDLTIAILRAMGIPAREINGYAHSEDLSKKPLSVFYDNKDLLHSWVEFFDPKYGWVEIDPTWGQTSGLDFFSKLGVNHIVFVRKENPNSPLPPGVYKDATSNKKSITITFGNDALLKGDAKPINDFLTKGNKFNIIYIFLIAFLATPALYMIYLILKGILAKY